MVIGNKRTFFASIIVTTLALGFVVFNLVTLSQRPNVTVSKMKQLSPSATLGKVEVPKLISDPFDARQLPKPQGLAPSDSSGGVVNPSFPENTSSPVSQNGPVSPYTRGDTMPLSPASVRSVGAVGPPQPSQTSNSTQFPGKLPRVGGTTQGSGEVPLDIGSVIKVRAIVTVDKPVAYLEVRGALAKPFSAGQKCIGQVWVKKIMEDTVELTVDGKRVTLHVGGAVKPS